MKTISLKIDDSIFGETEVTLSKRKKPRNRYIGFLTLFGMTLLLCVQLGEGKSGEPWKNCN